MIVRTNAKFVRKVLSYVKEAFMSVENDMDAEHHILFNAFNFLEEYNDTGVIEHAIYNELCAEVEDWGLDKTLQEVKRLPTKKGG